MDGCRRSLKKFCMHGCGFKLYHNVIFVSRTILSIWNGCIHLVYLARKSKSMPCLWYVLGSSTHMHAHIRFCFTITFLVKLKPKLVYICFIVYINELRSHLVLDYDYWMANLLNILKEVIRETSFQLLKIEGKKMDYKGTLISSIF